MKKILIVLGDYSTGKSPNAICVSGIIEELEKKYINVDLLSVELDGTLNRKKSTTKRSVHFVNYPVDGINLIKLNFTKLLALPLRYPKAVKLLKFELDDLLKTNKYDAIIAVSHPIETIEAVAGVSRDSFNGKKILYEIDPASNRYKYPKNIFEKYWKIKSMKWENKVYNEFDVIIHMVTHKRHYNNEYFKKYDNKTTYLDIPGLEISNNLTNKVILDNKKINFLYAGAFYPDLRKPDYFIDFFKNINGEINFDLNIYTNSMRKHIIRRISGYEDRIILHNTVPENLLNEYIDSSVDCLISIGNFNSDFLPSKVLKNIASLKPVIHFYKDNEDVALNYYKDYPYALLLSELDDYNENKVKLKKFLKEINKVNINKESILKKFVKNTNSFSANEIYKLVYDDKENGDYNE